MNKLDFINNIEELYESKKISEETYREMLSQANELFKEKHRYSVRVARMNIGDVEVEAYSRDEAKSLATDPKNHINAKWRLEDHYEVHEIYRLTDDD